MMSYLRRLRHTLLLKNENRKHIIFLFAEVSLIFIGITSALQLENWKEIEENRNQEITLLNQIQNELTLINLDVQNDLEEISIRSKKALKLYKMCGNKDVHISEFEFMTLAQEVFETNTFNPQYSVIDEAINTGSLSLIQNDDLRHELYQNNKSVDKVRKYVEKFNTYIFEFAVRDHLQKIPYRNWDNIEYDDLHIGESRIDTDVFELLNELSFENQVGMVFYYCQRFMVWYKEDVIEQNIDIINQISVELEHL